MGIITSQVFLGYKNQKYSEKLTRTIVTKVDSCI